MPRLVKTQTQFEGRFEETWTLVEESDELPPWEEDARLTVVGTPRPRQDGGLRATGAARFTVDVELPGMLRTPCCARRTHTRASSRSTSTPHARCRACAPPSGRRTSSSPAGVRCSAPTWSTSAPPSRDRRRHRRCGGGGPARPRPAVGGAGVLHLRRRGDRRAALPRRAGGGRPRRRGGRHGRADARIEFALETPGHLQTPLEPHGAVAGWQDHELTAWVSTQGMFAARDELCRRFGIERERVRVRTDYVGGGFGGKQGAGPEALLATALSRLTRRPVRVINDRHAEQLVGGRRAATRQSVRLGATRDGRLVAVDADALVAIGAAGPRMPVLTPAMTLYRCDDVRGLLFPLKVNLAPSNAFRAPGVMEGTACMEQAMDVLAAELGLDPLELRRRNHADVDQKSGEPYSVKALDGCMTRAAELAGWAERDRLREPQPDGLLRGMGCALQIWWGSGSPPAHATIRLGSDAVALVTTGIQDIGTGTLTAAQIVAAESLGLPPERVIVRGGDTGPNVYGPVSGGSMTTPSVMPAVRAAGEDVRRQLLDLAGDVFEANPADLELVAGRIRSADGALDEPVSTVAEKLGDATIAGDGGRGPNPEGRAIHSFGCQIAQVAVDPGTGEVRCERVVAVHDIGRVINPLNAASQVEGGVLQGMAFALLEEYIVDPTTGAPVTGTLDDYKLPTIADTPEVVVDFVEVPDRYASSVGSKGLGEPPIVPTAAAIANAFAHATGRRAAALPLTPARVIEALA